MINEEHERRPDGLCSLDAIEPETFHTLSYRDQMVVLNNTTIKIEDSFQSPQPLSLETVSDEELRILQYLINKDDAVGPFASMTYEFPEAWQNYMPTLDEELWKAMEFAEEHKLWEKYTGSVYYDLHSMGAIVHALRLILEGEMSGEVERITFSPAKAIPAYIDALEMIGDRKEGAYLFVGALSPLSVSGIWGVKKYLLPENASMTIVDVEEDLNKEAAKHYTIDFLRRGGEDTGFPPDSQEAVFTNSVTPWFDEYYPRKLRIRRNFFEESKRILKAKGSLVMIEHPFIDPFSEKPLEEQSVEDFDRIQTELIEAGFENIQIVPARIFTSQIEADTFLKTGMLNTEHVKSANPSHIKIPPMLIVARAS